MTKKPAARRLSRAPTPPLSVFLLGTLRLERARQEIHLPRRKVQALLAYLILNPGEHTRDQLATLFWGESTDEQARMSLRTSLTTLRKQIDAEIILADREAIQINPAYPLWVDAFEFEKQAAASPQTALNLYRGDLFVELYDDWILTLREHYRELYLEMLLQLTQTYRTQSEYEKAIELARRVLASEPANERAYQHLMFCQMALGNRQAAFEEYDHCVQALWEELAVEPAPETQGLARWIKQAPAETTSPAARITNLPIPLTSFIGRTREMTETKQLLMPAAGQRTTEGSPVRLLTLTGAGGSGKTRLSIQVATDLIDSFKDGVWWVEFGAFVDPALVPQAVAKALGVSEVANKPLIETLVGAIQPKQLLLVLDNCEHLIGACAQLAEQLLSTCPQLEIIATSREALNIAGERVWHVPTLSIPVAQPTSLAELLLSYEGIRLFVERAHAARTDFALTDQNAFAIAQICKRLDGIPLAIELAAARVRTLQPEQIAQRLDDRFNLLTGGSRTALPRQQTLRALIDWSYNLLAEEERMLFRQLSVFAGRFTLEALEQVWGYGGMGVWESEKKDDMPTRPRLHTPIPPYPHTPILDLLTRLVDKSLVLAVGWDGESHYRLLETIRDYAGEKLTEAGEAEAARARDAHLHYYLGLAERAERELDGAQQAKWMERLEQEHDNVRAALHWAHTTRQVEPGSRIAAALWRFWKVRGHYTEGRTWVATFLELAQHDLTATTTTTRARTFYAAGMLAYYQSDYVPAAQFQEQSLAMYRELNDKGGISRSLSGLGLVARGQGDYRRAQTLFEESLALGRELNDTEGVATCLRYLGLVAVAQGEATRAVALYEQALPLYDQLGDQEAYANLLNNLGIALSYLGNLERAQKLTEESLSIRRQLGDPHGIALSLHSLSFFAKERKNWKRAKDLLCESLHLYQSIGTKENTLECMESIALLEFQQDQLERAAQLYSAAEALRTSLHIPRQAYHRAEFDAEVAQVRAKLNAPTFTRAWNQGQSLSLEQAVAYASTVVD